MPFPTAAFLLRLPAKSTSHSIYLVPSLSRFPRQEADKSIGSLFPSRARTSSFFLFTEWSSTLPTLYHWRVGPHNAAISKEMLEEQLLFFFEPSFSFLFLHPPCGWGSVINFGLVFILKKARLLNIDSFIFNINCIYASSKTETE